MIAARVFVFWAVALLFGSCGLPPLMMDEGAGPQIAPSGPSVAAVLANVKCELFQAVNDEQPLPYYRDVPGLPPHRPPMHPSPDREFTLKNLFSEIEYVAELKLTLETTDSGALNPSVNFIQPLAVATTNVSTAVGGQVFASTDRIFDLYQSIDFQRLVRVDEHPLYKRGRIAGLHFPFASEPGQAEKPYEPSNLPDEWVPCDRGLMIHGKLGLREDLATAAIANSMQDASVLLKTTTSSGTVYGQTPALSGFNGYAFGEMDTTINFTVNLDLNVGPNWTLTTFKGPNVSGQGGVNGSGLLNGSRFAKDTLTLTVIPVCIRQKYFPQNWKSLTPSGLKAAASSGTPAMTVTPTGDGGFKVKPDEPKKNELPVEYPMTYTPEMMWGTPHWANYLPPCLSAAGQANIAGAPAAAKTNLQLQGIDNLLRSQRRF